MGEETQAQGGKGASPCHTARKWWSQDKNSGCSNVSPTPPSLWLWNSVQHDHISGLEKSHQWWLLGGLRKELHFSKLSEAASAPFIPEAFNPTGDCSPGTLWHDSWTWVGRTTHNLVFANGRVSWRLPLATVGVLTFFAPCITGCLRKKRRRKE